VTACGAEGRAVGNTSRADARIVAVVPAFRTHVSPPMSDS